MNYIPYVACLAVGLILGYILGYRRGKLVATLESIAHIFGRMTK